MTDKVIDLNAFRRKKQEVKTETPESMDFGDRTARIKKSLERINTLMSELKSMSKKTDSNNQK